MRRLTQLAFWGVSLFISFKSQSQLLDHANLELRISEGKPAFICQGEPVKVDLIGSPKTHPFKLFRNDEFVETVLDGQTEIYRRGIYFAIVEIDGIENRTKELVVEECSPFIQQQKHIEEENSINLISASISSSDYVLCGSQTAAHLEAFPKGEGLTYTWFFSTTSSGIFMEIPDSTSDHLTVENLGFYKVMVSDGIEAPDVSSSFQVVNNTSLNLSDMNGNSYSTSFLNPGDSLELIVSATGLGGTIGFTLKRDFGNSSFVFNNLESPATVKVPVFENSTFYIQTGSTECGNISYSNGNIRAITNPGIDVLYNTQLTRNVCAGEIIEIPYTEIGNWGTTRSFSYSIFTLSGNYVGGVSGLYKNPLEIKIPENLQLNTAYKVSLSLSYPTRESFQSTNFYLNVTSIGCQSRPIVTISGLNESCNQVYMYTATHVNGNNYQWYRNNVLINGATSQFYYARETGNYRLQVTNSMSGYNQTSTEYPITITSVLPVINSADPTLCNKSNGTSIALSHASGSFISYQWTYSKTNDSYTDIPGANSSSYQAKISGYFKLKVFSSNGCENLSNAVMINSNGGFELSDNTTGGSSSEIFQGQSAAIKINFSGEPPYFLQYNYDNNVKTLYSTSNQQTIFVSPEHNTQYLFYNFSNGCGTGSSWNYSVKVKSAPAITLGTPSSTILCRNGRITVPYYTSGSWGSKRRFLVELVDQKFNYIPNSYRYISSQNQELIYEANQNLPPGTYYFRVVPISPSDVPSVLSNFTITVQENSCTYPQARIDMTTPSGSCLITGNILEAFPKLANATYNWYLNGNLFQSSNSNQFQMTSQDFSATISVQIIDNGSGYNSTSSSIYYTFPKVYSPLNSYSYPDLCSPPITLYASSGSGATYEWYKAPSGNFGFEVIPGANSFNYSATTPGVYRSKTSTPECELVTDRRCDFGIFYEPVSLCKGGSVAVKFDSPGDFNSPSSTDLKFQLIHSLTNTVVVDNLLTLENPGYSFQKSQVIQIPSTVNAGNYKVRMIRLSTSESVLGLENITIKNSSAILPPEISVNPSTITQSSTVTLSITGCSNSAIEWENFGSSSPTLYVSASPGNQFRARCLSFEGCNSDFATAFVDYDCSDPYEPNNSQDESKLIDSTNYISAALCLRNTGDKDWFRFSHNGRLYFVEIKAYNQSTNIADQFYFSKSTSGSTVILTTVQNNPQFFLDTYMQLFDDQGNLLAQNDDFDYTGLSRIIFTPSNPCQNMVNLASPNFDLYSLSNSLIKSSDSIEASILQHDNTINIFEAGNSIELKPGFETKLSTAGIFKTEIKNCVD